MKARTICFVALTVLMVTVTATHPLSAQRRTTNQSVVKQNTDKENKNREQAEKKAVRSTERHTVSGNPFNRRSTTGQNSNESPNVKTTAPLRRNNEQAAPQERRSLNRKTPDVKDNKTTVRRKPQTSKQNVTRRSRAEKQRESFRNNQPSEIRKGKTTNVSPRARNDHHRKVYKLDAGDNRFRTSKNFKGNNTNWSLKHASYHVHYMNREAKYYEHYNHIKYSHWDNRWESYNWTINSWKEYYSGYHPYSYRFHKHYYYHPAFGHVVRRFSNKPVSFIHNNIRFYNYNGHFFRHFKGVGFVLIDMPYGVVFQKLPSGYEKVYINGFLYFRVDNLYFEANPNGFALIHYPERYHSLESSYYNGGYYQSVDYIF